MFNLSKIYRRTHKNEALDQNGENIVNQTKSLLQKCDWITSEILIKDLIRKYPHNADCCWLFGRLCAHKAQFDAAISYFKKCIQLLPNHADCYCSYGSTLGILKKYNDQQKMYKKCLQLNPSHHLCHFHYGVLYEVKSDYKNAEKHYKQAIEVYNKDSKYYTQYGSLLKTVRRYDEAQKMFEVAITINPNDANAYYLYSKLLQSMGNLHDANTNVKKAIKLNPNKHEYQRLLYIMNRSKRKPQKSQKSPVTITSITNNDVFNTKTRKHSLSLDQSLSDIAITTGSLAAINDEKSIPTNKGPKKKSNNAQTQRKPNRKRISSSPAVLSTPSMTESKKDMASLERAGNYVYGIIENLSTPNSVYSLFDSNINDKGIKATDVGEFNPCVYDPLYMTHLQTDDTASAFIDKGIQPNLKTGLNRDIWSMEGFNMKSDTEIHEPGADYTKSQPIVLDVMNDIDPNATMFLEEDNMNLSIAKPVKLTVSEPQHIAHIAPNESEKITNYHDSCDVERIDSEMDNVLRDILESMEIEINEERENLCNSYWDQMIPQNSNGMISCPLHTDTNDNNVHDFNDNNNQNQSNAPHKNYQNQNNDKNHNKRDHRKHNGNNDKNGKNDIFTNCNHLNECEECNTILREQNEHITKQNEQIRLLKLFLRNGQQIHKYRSAVDDIMCKAITKPHNKNHKKSRSKNRKPRVTTAINEPSLDPIYGAKRNVKISRKLTENVIPQTIKERINNVYSYLHISIGMQYNDEDGNTLSDTPYKVIHLDLHDEKDDDQYGVMDRIDPAQNTGRKWHLRDKLYTAKELPHVTLPQSSRKKLQNESAIYDIQQFIFDKASIRSIIKQCKWSTIPVFKSKNNKKRVTLAIIHEELNPIIHQSLLNINDHKNSLIPIAMFDSYSHWIEHILIVNVQRDIDIGISLRFDDRNGIKNIKITGIHLNKEKILEQHEAVLSLSPQCQNGCHCLDNFNSSINLDDIYVGNPDTLLNQVKNYRQKYCAFKQFMIVFINSKYTAEKYEILQKHAALLIMNENGSLVDIMQDNVVSSPSVTSIRSNISSTSSSSDQYVMSPQMSVSSNSDNNQFNHPQIFSMDHQ